MKHPQLPVRFTCLVTIFLLSVSSLLSQEGASGMHSQDEAEHHEHHHQIQLVIAHTHISNGRNAEGDRTWLALASWGLNYNYHFDEKWSAGLHMDFIAEQFKVESGDVIIERSRPLAFAGMAGYKFWGPLTALVGGGIELAEEDNLTFMRLGIEPAWPFAGHRWEFSVIGIMEFKFEAYNSWFIGFGLSRLF